MAKIKQLTIKSVRANHLPLVIGYFNCIHVMHVQLLTKYHNFNVLTFNDFHSKKNRAIYSFNERISNIEKYKPENIYILDLNKRNMRAIDFIYKILNSINPSDIVVGEDFRFGADQKGVDFLKNYFKVDAIKYNKQISTTNIVNSLKKADLDYANDYLDEPYHFISKWISGRKLGKVIGFRTINLKVNEHLVLPDGTYVTTTKIGNKKYKSISFLGTSKTTGSIHRTLECHILNKKLAPRTLFPNKVKNNVKVSFLKFIRKNKKFENGKKLSEQIQKDQQKAIKYFKQYI